MKIAIVEESFNTKILYQRAKVEQEVSQPNCTHLLANKIRYHRQPAMICRRCLYRASALIARESPSILQPTIRTTTTTAVRLTITTTRPFSQTTRARSSSPAPSPPDSSDPPTLSTPLGTSPPTADSNAAAAAGATQLSSCTEGTVLMGLNYFKNRTDPVALADNAYPSWLWRCMDVQKRADEEAADDAGDEFCEFFLSSFLFPSFFLSLFSL